MITLLNCFLLEVAEVGMVTKFISKWSTNIHGQVHHSQPNIHIMLILYFLDMGGKEFKTQDL